MTRPPPREPLIAVIGATGTGKSELAVEIAKRYNGEVINGDAMQLYEGLPIITNKITLGEQQGVPHHLLGEIGLHEQTWVVGTFVRNALQKIREIRSRGRLPVLVGGTHYYTQSLLFQDRLADQDDEEEKHDFVDNLADTWPILKESTEVLLEELKKVDPVMADRWHPNDRRKIQRSLEIYLQTGKKASDIYERQRARKNVLNGSEDSALLGNPSIRFPTLLFWVHAENEALRDRLDRRVDKMLEAGLLSEVETLSSFAGEQQQSGVPIDTTKGIWVSIGYKEFKEYVQALRLNDTEEQHLFALRHAALQKTQAATRQYAKRQIRWIRIKLVNALAEANSSDRLYLLDSSDVSKYDECVVQPALDLTGKFLRAEDMPDTSSFAPAAAELLLPRRDYDMSAAPEKWMKQHCSVCKVTCVTPEQWQSHTKSKAHRKLASKARRTEASDEKITR